ncbi:hypothetical protein M2408_003549 [Sphingobacterium sp. BIGb0165]|nr:hypothetical protein [Sphingobacterium sp. BIGb0165]
MCRRGFWAIRKKWESYVQTPGKYGWVTRKYGRVIIKKWGVQVV